MTWIIRAALVLAVVYVYAPVRSFPFIVFDDPAWLVENTLVNRGFSFEAVGRAFSESVLGNWVPLTWLSHMLDVSIFDRLRRSTLWWRAPLTSSLSASVAE